ncbi:MAG: MarR family transcriptional regulator [Verrucomicrobia bacterium]|nr:MarR family transcriptional regulator [Verrucomicrobiota bacterium]
MTSPNDMQEQVGFILATGKRIRDYMFRVQGESIRSDSALTAFSEMTMQQMSVAMMTLDRGEVTVTQMAGLLGVSLPSASAMIDRLVEKGVLVRSQDDADRRRVLISIAPDARKHLANVQARMQEAIAHLANQLGRATTAKWFDVMREVSAVLDNEEQERDT